MAQQQDPDIITVWTVRADNREAVFDNIDVALAYLRSDFGTNGSPHGSSVESSRMSRRAYQERVELEDGGFGLGGRN